MCRGAHKKLHETQDHQLPVLVHRLAQQVGRDQCGGQIDKVQRRVAGRGYGGAFGIGTVGNHAFRGGVWTFPAYRRDGEVKSLGSVARPRSRQFQTEWRPCAGGQC
ncbi:hypothetical protein D3C87_1774200 [compost metagenome]